jgi:hypothetical protein
MPLDVVLRFPLGIVSAQQVTAVAFLDLGDRFERHRRLPPRRLIVRLDALVPDQVGRSAIREPSVIVEPVGIAVPALGKHDSTLGISEDTTKSHIRHILAKLSLRDRAQAIVIAYETGLVSPGG